MSVVAHIGFASPLDLARVRLDLAQQLGFRKHWETAGVLTMALINQGIATDVWEDPFIEDQAREAANFQISCLIYGIIAGILVLVAVGALLIPVVMLFHVIMTILAAVAANKGETYRYPLCIRFLK